PLPESNVSRHPATGQPRRCAGRLLSPLESGGAGAAGPGEVCIRPRRACSFLEKRARPIVGWLMRNPQRARDLAKFLAPALEHAGGIAAEPGSPDGCSCQDKVAGPAEPAVDFAIGLELREVRKKVPSPRNGEGGQAAGEFGDRLTKVLEGDDHAVDVLWALLAGRGDQPRADALPES